MGRKSLAAVGERYGTRVIVGEAPKKPSNGAIRFVVRCDCGLESVVYGHSIAGGSGCRDCKRKERKNTLSESERQARFDRKPCGTTSKYYAGCRCEKCLKARAEELRNYRKTEAGRRATKNSNLKQSFGITLEDYEVLFKQHRGECAGCGIDGDLITSDQSRSLVVDHCHKSGEIRGLLCHNCNLAVGMFRDDHEIISNAAAYLEGAIHDD